MNASKILLIRPTNSLQEIVCTELAIKFEFTTKILTEINEVDEQLRIFLQQNIFIILDTHYTPPPKISAWIKQIQSARSIMGLAVITSTGQKTVGMLTGVFDHRLRLIIRPQSQEELLQSIYDVYSEALLQFRWKHMWKVLQHVTSILRNGYPIDQALQQVCEKVVEYFQVDQCGIVLFEPNYLSGNVIAKYPQSNNESKSRIPIIPIPIERQLIEKGEQIYIPDISQTDGLQSVKEILLGDGIKSILITPIKHNSRTIASISMDSYEVDYNFSDREKELSNTIADNLSSAITNSIRLTTFDSYVNTFASNIEFDSINTLLETIFNYFVENLHALNVIYYRFDSLQQDVALYKQHVELQSSTKFLDANKNHLKKLVTGSEVYASATVIDHEISLNDLTQSSYTILSACVKDNEDIIGVLSIIDFGSRIYTDDTILITKRIADYLASQISRFQLRVMNRNRQSELEMYDELIFKFVGEETLDTKLLRIVEGALILTQSNGAKLYLIDTTTQMLKLSSVIGEPKLRKELEGQIFPLTQGMAGHIVTNSLEELIVTDYRSSPYRIKDLAHLFVSVIEVSLKVGTRILGVLGVFYSQKQDQSTLNAHLPVLKRLSRQAAISIYSQQQIDQQTAISEVSQAISQSIDLEDTFYIILDRLFEVIPYYRATLQLISGKTRSLLAWKGYPKDVISLHLLRDVDQDPLINRVITMEEPLVLPETQSEPDWEVVPETSNILSWVGVPIVFRNEVIGLLTLDHYIPNFFSTDHVKLLLDFASESGHAIHTKLAIEKLKTKNHQLHILGDLAATLVGGLNYPKESLSHIANAVKEMFEADYVVILPFLGEDFLSDWCTVSPDGIHVGMPPNKPRSSGITYRIFDREFIRVPNVAEWSQIDGHFVSQFVEEKKINSFLGIALTETNENRGIIFVDYCEKNRVNDIDMDLIKGVAQITAGAISVAYQLSARGSRANQIRETLETRPDLSHMPDTNSSQLFYDLVAHNIRQHLFILGNNLEIFLDHAAKNKKTSKTSYKRIYNTSVSIQEDIDTISDFLDIAESYERTLRKIDLSGLVYQSIRLLTTRFKSNEIQINNNTDQPLFTFGNEYELLDVLLNLLTNAIKSIKSDTKKKKVVEVRSKVIKGPLIQIEIIDSGIGIRAEDQRYIFQLHNTYWPQTADVKGTGVGLAYCKRVIDQHGGKIFFTSKYGEGTIFTVHLPFDET